MWTEAKIESELVLPEWRMFQDVQNEGGRADCQDDKLNFVRFRCAQFLTWTESMLESYRLDLLVAQAERRNLLTEKYAYMMASTDPDAFAEIKDLLPAIDVSKMHLIEEIVPIYVNWNEDLIKQQPRLAGRRPIHRSEDNAYTTSFETYLRGELATYSLQTLRLMRAHVQSCLNEGKNLLAENSRHIRALQEKSKRT